MTGMELAEVTIGTTVTLYMGGQPVTGEVLEVLERSPNRLVRGLNGKVNWAIVIANVSGQVRTLVLESDSYLEELGAQIFDDEGKRLEGVK